MRKATMQDLVARTYEFELVSPDEETFIVEMRALTQAEILEVDRSLPRPKPDVSDFRKNDDGQVQPVYDYEAPAYRHTLEVWGSARMRRLVLKSWVIKLPGETDDERLASLDHLSSWALSGLFKAVQLLIATQEDRVKLRSFQPVGKPADTDL